MALLEKVLEEVRPPMRVSPPSYIPNSPRADPDLLAFGVVGPRGRV